MESAVAALGLDWGLLFLHIVESLFVFLLYYPMLPVFWLTSHLSSYIGCLPTSNVLALLFFAGLFSVFEDFHAVIGVLLTYASGLGLIANALNCGDSVQVLEMRDLAMRLAARALA